MKKPSTYLRVFVWAGLLLLSWQAQARLVYVKSDAAGANNGSTWANAYTSLKTALDAAAKGDTLCVAKGIYTTGAARTVPFSVKDSVALFGGFAGSETISPSVMQARNFVTNETIISGDLNGNDATELSLSESTRSDNTNNLFFFNSTTSPLTEMTIFDGFTIQGGHSSAAGSGYQNTGGAFYFVGKVMRPIFRNLIIKHNVAKDGGAMHFSAVANSEIAPTFYQVKFINNMADETAASQFASGGAINLSANNTNLIANFTLTKVDFEGNRARGYYADGGAIRIFSRYSGQQTTLHLDSCSFQGNTAEATHRGSEGGAFKCEVLDAAQATIYISNTFFCGNQALGAGGYLSYGGAYFAAEGINGTGTLASSFTNVTMASNAAHPTAAAMYLTGANNGAMLKNTLIQGTVLATSSAAYTSSFSLVNTGSPKLADPASCDLRLKLGSDALGAATAPTGPI
ncbi:MAG: hypothetical protein HC842_03260 [Cytophagales bacterium]|nr:hypothetical protein [Cytophagales bacterium]